MERPGQAHERRAVHASRIRAAEASAAHGALAIEDLDDVFDGDWQVPRAPFERVAEQMVSRSP
jgi:hypothetical protein